MIIKQIEAVETYQIRKQVLRNGVDLSVEFEGDFNPKTIHLGAFVDAKLVGIASLMKSAKDQFKGDQYQLRGMATLPEVRGKGFGKELIKMAIEILKEKNIAILWCNARQFALTFYQALGFECVGEPFEIPEIGVHYVLKKEIQL